MSRKPDESFEDEEENTSYQPPKDVPIIEIINKDTDDQSLNEYKKKLLGEAINVIIGKCKYVFIYFIKYMFKILRASKIVQYYPQLFLQIEIPSRVVFRNKCFVLKKMTRSCPCKILN